MSDIYSNEPMLEMYIVEMNQMINRLEQLVISGEEENNFDDTIDEIFRLMHTIKGNSMMMMFDSISKLAHAIEDLYDFLRKKKPKEVNYSKITDLVLEATDFFKMEVESIELGDGAKGDSEELNTEIIEYLESLKFMNVGEKTENDSIEDDFEKSQSKNRYYISPQKRKEMPTIDDEVEDVKFYEAVLFFEDGCQMESVRAFTVIHKLKEISSDIYNFPKDVVENNYDEDIRMNGFHIYFSSDYDLAGIKIFFDSVALIREINIDEIDKDYFIKKKDIFEGKIIEKPLEITKKEIAEIPEIAEIEEEVKKPTTEPKVRDKEKSKNKESYISVSISKIDQLLDLVGELVVSESMVTRNVEIASLKLESFEKAVRQHRFIINEFQDIVMSIRMVPLALTFQKMSRIVRDMKKKIGKDVELEIIGENTEVDKNVIENIGDPLMHIIRNSIDHGIESPEKREKLGKNEKGKITLEAKHAGGDVWITIKDDGGGLNKEQILEKAHKNGILKKDKNEYSDQEVYSMIFQPGFSTKEKVTEFSGRGVGLDVVSKNIQKLGGSVIVNSKKNVGSEFAIRIPLTLAIIDGMFLKVGDSSFTVPITSMKESFRPEKKTLIKDIDGNEMILVRNKCYPIVKLFEKFNIETQVREPYEGIVIMLESEGKEVCIFADEIIGEQQVVVKGLSKFLRKVDGISGCTLLADGRISLILDPSEIVFEY